MNGSNSAIIWSMRNFRIVFLLVACLFVFGIYALVHIPKQEFPEYTIRQGVVAGIYPGATAEEVEEQLTRPLEQFLMTYKEVKRPKTTSVSQNGMCYVMVELNDEVNDKDEVWSKIKHGLAGFKMQLPQGVVAVVANDDFGDTSALLITLESDTRSYRELKDYLDRLCDRLRRIESVSNLRPYGVQQEQVSIYVDRDRLAAYGIGEKALTAALASQGLTPLGGAVSNRETQTPIHLAPSLVSEREVAEQIIWTDPEGHVLRVGDVARVVREYDDPDSYIRNNGRRCVLLSMEMRAGFNIVEYGRRVDGVLHDFIEMELPSDVHVQRIADQAKVVGDSVHSFLRDLFVAMAIIIVVMMLLFPMRSAIVAAITIPLSTFISVGVMYLFGIPLNTVTLAALVVVLGMIVDNSIVVIDGYLDYLSRGHSRWYAAAQSAREFFPSLLLATACICMIFYPLLFTMTGMMGDFLTWFPWTITINLAVSLLLAVLVIPFLEILIIPAVHPRREGRKPFTERVQDCYRRVLAWTFRHGWLTVGLGAASVAVALWLVSGLKMRMLPFADRDQFAVEIYLPADTPLERTASVADSVYRALAGDERVGSVTSFVGCSSPRFQMSYAPQIAGRNYAQLIVNTTSMDDTEAILDDYADSWADRFPEAYVKFKQLDYQNVPSLEFRFYGDDIDSLRAAADALMDRMRRMPELHWVHTDYDDPRAVADVRLDPVTASQLGVTRAVAAANLALAGGDAEVGAIWEGDYKLPVVLKSDERRGERSLADVGDTYISSPVPGVSVPLRQIADVRPVWSESRIAHRNGMRCMTVTAELRRGTNAMRLSSRIQQEVEKLSLPAGVIAERGGAYEFDWETIPPIAAGLSISLIIIFFFILINFRKFGITLVVMASMSLCLFGAVAGLRLAGYTIGLTSVLGLITLLGMIVRNVILMYQHAEDKRKVSRWSARLAAYDAGKRRMVPIFLTTATTAVGVVPMMLGGSSFWAPVGVTIFAGGIGSLILVVTVLPVLYSKIYK